MRFNTVWREANSNRLRLSVFRAASRETLVTDHFTNSGYVLVSATVAK